MIWELKWFGDLSRDGSGDYDNDGVSDLEEYNNGIDPTKKDTDSDEMPDGWEIEYGLNPLVDDSDGDADGDGFKNFLEFIRGTDPNDSESHPSRGLPWLNLLLGDD